MPTNPLTEILPAKMRQYAYAALFVAAVVFAAFQASDGDWKQFAGGVITALLGATAASNTGPTPTRGEDGAVDPGSAALGALVAAVVVYLIMR
jgi:hypothetical protein